mmetsp:Transcript_24401/g.42740  ORF Transcript_24401/g.42740 Transcript_24401/m.42740 type:complete len:81 (+) Transcript_24401:445-687(+)
MRALKSSLTNTILVLFIIPNDILTPPPVCTKRMLRIAPQHHAALRSAIFARKAGEGIAIHDRLAAAAALSPSSAGGLLGW